MKQRIQKWLTAALFLLICTAVLLPTGVQAAKKGTKWKAGKTYKVDLNGGKKESVKYVLEEIEDEQQQFKLYVNKKKVYSLTIPNQGRVAKVYLADLKTSDKYREIVVNYDGSFSSWGFFVLRYGKNKKITEYISQDEAGFLTSDRVRVDGGSKVFKGNGTFYTEADTPFTNDSFGNYYARVPAKLSGGKIRFTKASSYKLLKVKEYVDGVFMENYYITSKPMKLYKKDSLSASARTKKNGLRFTPLKIVLAGSVQVSEDGYSYTKHNLFVQVKTKSGETGWLYFPGNTKEDYLMRIPLWG